MGRGVVARTWRTRESRSIAAIIVLVAWVLLILPSVAAADPLTIDVTNDANQSPVFTTFTDQLLANPATWNEFQWVNRAYPLLGGFTANKSLPTVHIFAPVPDGNYWVFANLYGQPDASYRYYYGYQAGDPLEFNVAVGPQADCAEIQLRPVNVVNGQFNLYVQRADMTSGAENYFGWAWVRLVPTGAVTSSPASSTWSILLLASIGGLITVWSVRRLAL